MINIRELNDAQLEAVAGGEGLGCAAALYVANINLTTPAALQGIGDPGQQAGYFAGMAKGNLQSGCAG